MHMTSPLSSAFSMIEKTSTAYDSGRSLTATLAKSLKIDLCPQKTGHHGNFHDARRVEHHPVGPCDTLLIKPQPAVAR
jgi:hypothetical protein